MRIQVLSDIHVEFHGDKGRSFARTLNPDATDVLCIAGDAGTGNLTGGILKLICDMYAPKPVLYVPGNHEYYQSNFMATNRYLEGLGKDIENLTVLNVGLTHVKVGEQEVKFVGATMWFPDNPRNAMFSGALTDFRLIANFANEVYSANVRHQELLRAHASQGCVVLTHHAPSYYSVPRAYVGSEINRFFVCPMEELILDKKPALWLHGHTHTSFDYMIGDCRVVANPHGYYGTGDMNREFDSELVIEV